MEEKLDHAPAKPEAPVDSMLKDMATIILSTFLLIGWVAFIITYPLVRVCSSTHPTTPCPPVSEHLPVNEFQTKARNKQILFFPPL